MKNHILVYSFGLLTYLREELNAAPSHVQMYHSGKLIFLSGLTDSEIFELGRGFDKWLKRQAEIPVRTVEEYIDTK